MDIPYPEVVTIDVGNGKSDYVKLEDIVYYVDSVKKTYACMRDQNNLIVTFIEHLIILSVKDVKNK